MNPEIKLHTDFEVFSEDHRSLENHYKRNQWIYEFGDIKVSVVCHMFERRIITYGATYAPFELALLKDDELIGEPIGYLTEKKVNRILHEVDRAVKKKWPVTFLSCRRW